ISADAADSDGSDPFARRPRRSRCITLLPLHLRWRRLLAGHGVKRPVGHAHSQRIARRDLLDARHQSIIVCAPHYRKAPAQRLQRAERMKLLCPPAQLLAAEVELSLYL